MEEEFPDNWLEIAIESLGSTADHVRQTVPKGYRRSPGCCPVANYLKEVAPPGMYGGAWRTKVVMSNRGSIIYHVPLPPNVTEFIDNFDAGLYPELDMENKDKA